MQHLQPNATLQSGKYKIEKVLGQGGFGITYLASQSVSIEGPLGKINAEIKVTIKEFFMKDLYNRDEATSAVSVPSTGSTELVDKFRQKFIKEAQNISKLNHPNIIKVLDVFEENGTAYYVMEYIDGGSLNDLINRKGKLDEREAFCYTKMIAEALQYIHSMNMNHLDVKPANVLLRKNGEAVLIDFGLSKNYATTGEQTTSTPVGISVGYAPIEQSRIGGVGMFSPATDVYSLGATMFKMLTGEIPPEASVVMDDGLPEMKNVSSNIVKAIEKAMEPRRKSRYQSIDEFMAALEASSTEVKRPAVAPQKSDETQIIIPQEVLTTNSIANNVDDKRTIILSNPHVNSKEEKKQIQFDKIDDLESLDEETRLVLSKEDMAKIVLFGRKGIANQPCNQPVDIGLNVMWYNSNIGACDTYDGGDFCPKGDSFYEKYCINNEEKHIPTSDQWKELIQECEWTWVEEYNCTGFLIKGPNGKYIFLPAAGKTTTNGIEEDGFEGYYWSLGSANGNASVELNLKFTYPPSFKYIGLSYMPNVVAMPIRLVKNKL